MVFFTESVPRNRYQTISERSLQSDVAQGNVAYVGEATELKSIRLASINLAVWQRRANAAMLPVVHWLAKEPFEMEHEVYVKDVTSTLQDNLAVPAEFETARNHMIADIQELAALFSEYASTNAIRLMVESLHRVPCPKFHQDNVLLRLVCTYTGLGTEWLENSNVNPHPDCCGGSIVLDHTRIMRLNPTDVALMKGKRWPGNAMGIYHRSPTPEAGQPRLVMKMDVAQ